MNSVAPAGTDTSLETGNILVVEDDPSLCSALCYNLRRAGHTAIAAHDGEAALQTFNEQRREIDLILLDIMLPRLTGLQLLRVIRESSTVPAVILSARGEEQDRINGLDLGADDYLVKPFPMREMMARVRAQLRRRPNREVGVTPVIEHGPLRIDTVSRRAWVGPRELVLRPKEYGLLLALTNDAGKLFTRQDLLDAVWGADIFVDERTVDVHVSWLRGKLRRAGLTRDLIQTVYGAGYRLNAEPGDHLQESRRHDGGGIQASRVARFDNAEYKEKSA
jgi:two-component system, OmpR family, phosphate regulon response regulator PhoB